MNLLCLKKMKKMFLIALSVTGSRQDAEDVMQAAFLKLWEHRGGFEDTEHMDRWLTRVCVNEARSLLRRPWRKHVSLEETQAIAAEAPPASQDLIASVMALEPSYRTVIHLYYYEELSTGEIAALLHLSESAVRQRLSRGRKQLKLKLEEANETR